MSGQQVLILLLSAGLLYTGTTVSKYYIDSLDKDRALTQQVEKDKTLINAQTKQMEILASVVGQYPAVKKIQAEAEEVHYQILKGASEADEIAVNGVQISGKEARAITDTARQTSKTALFVEPFRVLAVDTSDSTMTKVKVRKGSTEFWAAFNDDSLDSKAIRLLQKHLLSREPVRLRIEGKKLSGKILNARIIAVAPKLGVAKPA